MAATAAPRTRLSTAMTRLLPKRSSSQPAINPPARTGAVYRKASSPSAWAEWVVSQTYQVRAKRVTESPRAERVKVDQKSRKAGMAKMPRYLRRSKAMVGSPRPRSSGRMPRSMLRPMVARAGTSVFQNLAQFLEGPPAGFLAEGAGRECEVAVEGRAEMAVAGKAQSVGDLGYRTLREFNQ